MGNLTKNTITRGAVVALALSAGAATTANAAVTRTSGADRYATANAIFKAWPTTPTTAILAAGVGHDVDALTVAPLATKKNAPVILVDTAATPAAIVTQFAAFTTVYIANGTGVVSPAVEAALVAAGKTVVRLGGATRTETALKIAKEIGASNGIVVANGSDDHIVDTLSIASIAAAKGMPIFLTQNGALDTAELAYAKGLAATTVYALGGTTVVPDAATTGLGTLSRLAGPDRYSTNAAIVTKFKADLDLSTVYVASGEDANLIDALAGAPLAGLKKAPIAFAHNSINADVNTLLNNVVTPSTNVVILGGAGAVSPAVETSLNLIQNPTNVATAVSAVTAISAKSIKVTFNGPVADTSKVTFAVTRDAAAVAFATTTWNAAKTEATLTVSYQLFTGSYVVTPTVNAVKFAPSAAVAVTQSQVAKIAFTTTNAVLATGGTYFTAGIKVTNQYGEDITNNYTASSLQIVTSKGYVDSLTNGVIKIWADNGAHTATFTATETINVTAIDSATGVSSSQALLAANALAISSITLGDVTTETTNTSALSLDTLYSGGTDYWLPLTVKDTSGNVITDISTLQNNLTLLTSNPNIVGTLTSADIVTKNSAPAIKLEYGAATATYGNVAITAVSKSGVSVTKTVNVADAAKVDTFTITPPSDVVKAGVEFALPFAAADQLGNVLTTATGNLAPVATSSTVLTLGIGTTVSVTNGTIRAIVDASNKLIIDVTPTSASSKLVITAITATGKSQTISMTVNDAPTAKSITGVNSSYYTALQQGQVESLNLVDDNIDYTDQYGNDVARGTNVLSIAKTDGTASAASDAVSYNAGSFTASSTVSGTTQFTLTLKTSGGTVLDTRTLNMESVKLADITQFSLEDPGKLYTGIAYNGSLGSAAFNKTLVLDGLKANGTKVQVAQSLIKGVTVNSPIVLTGFTSITNASNTIDTSSADKTVTITATIEGASNPISITKTLTYSNSAPLAASLAVQTNNTDDSAITTNYVYVSAAAVISGSYVATVAGAAGASTDSTATLPISFEATNQYGVESEKDVVYTVTNVQNVSGTPIATTVGINSTTGKLTVTGPALVATNSFVLTGTVNGISKSIKVILN